MFKKLGVTYKKNVYVFGKTKKEREAYLSRIAEIPEKKRVYVDECGINEYRCAG
jgi:hypothetical protein